MAKGIGKEPRVTSGGELDLSPERAFVVKRTGKQVAALQQRLKVTKWVLLSLLLLVILLYLLFIFFGRMGGTGGDKGDFTVTVEKGSRNMISMSEFEDFKNPAVMLLGTSQHDMWHCTKEWIPEDLQEQSKGGAHSSIEPSYLAYTFYIKNVEDNEVKYTYDIDLVDEYVPKELKAIDALRIMVIKNGEETVWAKAPIDGSALEEGTKEFTGKKEVIEQKGNTIEGGKTDKFTVVMWFEGTDPECINDIFKSSLKFKMDFSVENPIKEKSDK
ncbi:MAG: hypothetical protein E7591_06575 [Ruminococcaceae bacterium]|nr:hypothetical protein [Oscillospiraceae bacterium]